VKTGPAKNILAGLLHTEPETVKALYRRRRAQANIGLGSHDEAEADLQDAAKLAPKEKSVAAYLP